MPSLDPYLGNGGLNRVLLSPLKKRRAGLFPPPNTGF
uniref:Uncharacterized protein n=1 Tax=Picea glauca TaxID=3330 RepID=A0A124GNY9_PICGL|nr:hypothetical protein ABT39_MTgene174 [Picea glauca]